MTHASVPKEQREKTRRYRLARQAFGGGGRWSAIYIDDFEGTRSKRFDHAIRGTGWFSTHIIPLNCGADDLETGAVPVSSLRVTFPLREKWSET